MPPSHKTIKCKAENTRMCNVFGKKEKRIDETEILGYNESRIILGK